MKELFYQILYAPFLNALVFFYNTIALEDVGLSIIFLTIAIRLVLSPLSLYTLVSQRKLQSLQPKLKELQEKHKQDRAALTQATMELYRTSKVNPFSGCLPLLIQLPVLIALYQVSISGFNDTALNYLYSFVEKPANIHTVSLGIIDVTERSVWLAVLAGVLQFASSFLTLRFSRSHRAGSAQSATATASSSAGQAPSMESMMNKQMLYFFPILTIIIAWRFPAGVPLYWITTTLFSIGEQFLIHKRIRAAP